jgi:hypothetical protein
MAQKAAIQIVSTRSSGLSDWQILDDQNRSVFSGAANQPTDSVSFNLDPNRLYVFRISVYEIYKSNAELFSLILNGEPLILITSDIGTGDHSIPFFTGVKAVNAKITGGINALISDFPWQIYYISGNFRCGGSIINGNWIVTAAHCTKNSTGGSILASDMFVKVGANNPANSTEGKTYAVNKVIVHEGFDDVTLLNDIALLRLTDTINFANATPINLVSSDDVAAGAIVPGVLSWVSGWGLTSVSPQVIPTVLQKVQLPIITNQQASTVWNSIPATDLMAGFLNGNKDACNGDSGGPLVVPVSGEYKLAGIVSWGSSSCNTYGAYSRVSDFESWIEKNTGLAPVGDSVICEGTVSSQYSAPVIPGSSAYQWVLLPSGAGAISGNGRKATVNWNLNYTGKASIILRATINGKVSDWFRVHASISPATKILSQSADTIICAGKAVTLNVKVQGHDLIYIWSRNGQVVQTGSSSKLSITSSKASDSGAYNCQITGSCGAITSNIINLTVYPVTKINTLSPNAEISFGKDLTLDVTAEGHDLVYKWLKDGVEISNSNTSQLVVHGVNATDIGLYRTIVTGTCGTVKSDSIYVYVKRANSTADPEVFLWPSVTSTEFSVAINNDSFYNIQIFNTSGKKFREQTNCQYQTRIDISTMAKGEYVVVVYNNSFRKSIKIIKV